MRRRDVLTLTALSLAGGPRVALSQRLWGPVPLGRFPRMVHEYFVARVREIEAASLRAQAALATRADAEAYVARVRRTIRELFGPLPTRGPLAARVTGRLDRERYVVEKVLFESRPGFLVTANLYVPRVAGRRPAVLGSCGHSAGGKAAPAYQSFAQGLALQGYVVLIFDPAGQGERLQYVDERFRSRVGAGVQEHLLAGNQQFLVGEYFGAWRAWDAIRALDYLLSRPEVDPLHVGMTGNSGGGTLTAWLCALDDRLTMAAPSCFVTTFRRNLENELPADPEQCPPGILAAGLDHADFLAAMAPRPVILLGKDDDYFDKRGTDDAFGRLKRLYALLGSPHRIALVSSPGEHGYARDNREAMYRWFNRWSGASDAMNEPALAVEKEEDLWAAPGGQAAVLKSRTVFWFTKERAETLARERHGRAVPPSGPALKTAVTGALRLERRAESPPEFRVLRPLTGRRHPRPHTAVYAIETEPGIHAIVYHPSDDRRVAQPARGGPRAVLWVADQSSDAELRADPLIAELMRAEAAAPFFACDVRGIGESQPDTCGPDSFLKPYGSDYFYAIHSIMLDRPYLGQKTHDVLRVLDWLASFGHVEVHLAGRGWGALPATFAGLLSENVVQVTLKNTLSSYTAVATTEHYRWPLSTFIPGVLREFDLDDCYRELADKKLRQVDVSGSVPTGR